MILAVVLIIAYLLGSIPNGLIFVRAIWHIDLRERGSQNTGATNAWRVVGKTAGLLVFALDFFKGFLAVFVAEICTDPPLQFTAMALAGIFAVIGHSLSVFMKFRGGKGVATGLGVITFLMPKVTAIVFLTWLVIVLATRYVSLGSIVAAVLTPILAWIFDMPAQFTLFGLAAAVLIVVRHRANIIRLINGNENKI